MTKQTIEVDGLPEGWKIKKAILIPRHNLSNKYEANAYWNWKKSSRAG